LRQGSYFVDIRVGVFSQGTFRSLKQNLRFLDNGDGEITLMEFIDGASRLRGSAKAIDVWRLETKLEAVRGGIVPVVP